MSNDNEPTRDLERIEDRVKDLERRVSRNSVAIYGNGKKGLTTRVEILEYGRMTKQRAWQTVVSVSSVIVAIVAAIVAIITAQ